LKARKIKSVLFAHEQIILKFSACLVQEKNKYKASLKTLTNSKNCPKAASNYDSGFSLWSYWSFFFIVYSWLAFGTTSESQADYNFKSHGTHGWLSESRNKLSEDSFHNN
jgi:hypothetical protein